MVNLYTNIVVFAMEGKLNGVEINAMQNEAWAICPIVLRELAFLVANNRIRLNLDGHRFGTFLERVELLPIDMNVARTSTQLDFRGDPADELIAATSIVYGVPLVTRDRVIRQSKLVPLAT